MAPSSPTLAESSQPPLPVVTASPSLATTLTATPLLPQCLAVLPQPTGPPSTTKSRLRHCHKSSPSPPPQSATQPQRSCSSPLASSPMHLRRFVTALLPAV